jgi:hypothetical protein
MPIKNVGDVLANAVVRERAGEPTAKAAADAVSEILKNGVTVDERNAVIQMMQNLKGTAHAGLADRIAGGIIGHAATTFQELKDKLIGPAAKNTQPSVTWRQERPTDAQQKDWNATITTSQVDLAQLNGQVSRGFHAKQIFGGKVTMKVNSDLPPEARIPPFWDTKADKPANLSGLVRMSNGQGCPYKDSGPDVRGLAVKLVDDKGKAWDILSTNHQTFAENPEEFIAFAKGDRKAQLAGTSLAGFVKGQTEEFIELTKDIGLAEATRISLQLAKDTALSPVDGMTTQSFDGGTFKTPDGHLAKILFTPVPNQVDTMTRKDIENDPNGLTTEMYKHFQSGPVKYRVQLKLFTGNGDELKANDKWDPAKIIDIGEMSIPPPDKNDDAKIQTVVNGMRFNPGTGFDPAGKMTHARGAQPGVNGDYETPGIYKTSADNRLALDDTPAVLAFAKNGTGLDSLYADVSARNEKLKKEVEDGTVGQRLG